MLKSSLVAFAFLALMGCRGKQSSAAETEATSATSAEADLKRYNTTLKHFFAFQNIRAELGNQIDGEIVAVNLQFSTKKDVGYAVPVEKGFLVLTSTLEAIGLVKEFSSSLVNTYEFGTYKQLAAEQIVAANEVGSQLLRMSMFKGEVSTQFIDAVDTADKARKKAAAGFLKLQQTGKLNASHLPELQSYLLNFAIASKSASELSYLLVEEIDSAENIAQAKSDIALCVASLAFWGAGAVLASGTAATAGSSALRLSLGAMMNVRNGVLVAEGVSISTAAVAQTAAGAVKLAGVMHMSKFGYDSWNAGNRIQPISGGNNANLARKPFFQETQKKVVEKAVEEAIVEQQATQAAAKNLVPSYKAMQFSHPDMAKMLVQFKLK